MTEEQIFLEFYNSKFSEPFVYGNYPDELQRDMFLSGYRSAKKELEEQLKEYNEIINELFDFEVLTSNDVYKLRERFKKLEIKDEK